ncbi:MAG: DUF3300 domain-containing protein [Betaproteobacteria bacterium]
MTRLIALLALCLCAMGAAAQQRVYSQPELDALVAPIALYPDAVVSQVLVASTYPQQVAHAAAWSRANAHLAGDNAVRAAEPYGWHPAVTGLVAFPHLLARMEESPQWVADLGQAYLAQEPHLMHTVQQLRLRAQASGHLRSDAQQHVYSSAGRVLVQPAYPHSVVLPYYNPLVVYGPVWSSYRPVYWRPWYARPVIYRWHPPHHWHAHRHVHSHHVHVQHHRVPIRADIEAAQRSIGHPHVRVPESQRRPIVQSHTPMPAAAAFSQAPRHSHVERRHSHERKRHDRRG